MLRWLTPINVWISRISLSLAVAGLFAIVAVVICQVVGRYVLNDTPIWAESSALVLVLYVTMLGAAVGVRDAGHIGLESILLLILPARYSAWVEVPIHAFVALFGILMVVHDTQLGLSVAPYMIPTLGISEGWNHLPLIIAGVLITMFSVEHMLALIEGKEVEPAWH